MSRLVFKGKPLKSFLAKAKNIFFDTSRTDLTSNNLEDVLNEMGALYNDDDALVETYIDSGGYITLKYKNGKLIVIAPKQTGAILLSGHYMKVIFGEYRYGFELNKPISIIASVNTVGHNDHYWLDLITQGCTRNRSVPIRTEVETLACSIHGYLGASNVNDPISAIIIGYWK